MHNLIRYFNQNRKKILIIIIIIAFGILLIQFLNYIIGEQARNNNQKNITNNTEVKDVTKPNHSIITDTQIPDDKVEENTTIIKKFVEYCNQKKYEQAYALLSNSCKEYVFRTQQDFINNYCNIIFNTNKTFSLESWINYNNAYTYRILYTSGNPLETGSISSSANQEDYITILTENGELKLNINKFIKEEIIGKEETENDITIKIDSKCIYLNYEIYKITIQNRTQNDILLSEGLDSKQICLVDQNDNEYISYINEVPLEHLQIKSSYQKQIEIKFNKMYNLSRYIKRIDFNNIYLNYNDYKNDANNASKITIRVKL